MIELIGAAAGPLSVASLMAFIAVAAKVTGLKGIIALWSAHLEMRATARTMRTEGASDKQVVQFLADHAATRAGRAP
ncbi:hypothetical protein [Cryobacterium sp. Y82]|uniref:hypothetical protein n=1 Tax=Cryobacterium sp. Y82 TaxID=2045017 RepID=UPI0011B0D876|nr:hypothetical protein [Cryobacterium sp. Y82]